MHFLVGMDSVRRFCLVEAADSGHMIGALFEVCMSDLFDGFTELPAGLNKVPSVEL